MRLYGKLGKKKEKKEVKLKYEDTQNYCPLLKGKTKHTSVWSDKSQCK